MQLGEVYLPARDKGLTSDFDAEKPYTAQHVWSFTEMHVRCHLASGSRRQQAGWPEGFVGQHSHPVLQRT